MCILIKKRERKREKFRSRDKHTQRDMENAIWIWRQRSDIYQIIKCKIATMMVATKKGHKEQYAYNKEIWPSQGGQEKFLKEVMLKLRSKVQVTVSQWKSVTRVFRKKEQ